MRDLQKNIIVIIPCYNEGERLKNSLEHFRDCPYRLIFVNDGSSDNTREFLEANIHAPDRVLSLDKNSGKAEAVRRGMLYLMSLQEYEEVQWAAFWDADLATPVSELADFLDFAARNGGADAVYGSRIMRLGSNIKRNFSRHVLGRLYCTLISALFGIKCYDTQCGAKVFRKSTLEQAFLEPFISRWVFDVEIILRLNAFKQLECPVKKWEDVKGSKIAPLKAFASVAFDILKIRRKYR